MTARVLKPITVLLLLSTALLMGSALLTSDNSAKSNQTCNCCQALPAKTCPVARALPCCQAKKQVVVCCATKDAKAYPGQYPKTAHPEAKDTKTCLSASPTRWSGAK